ncbi:---NA---, partial [Paramuricea clavata]
MFEPCKDPSSVISACSGSLGYKIPDFSNYYPSIPDLSETWKIILSVISDFHSWSERCSKDVTKFFCKAAYPFRCKDAYVEVDGKEIAATCDEAKKNCSSSGSGSGSDLILRDSLLNCSRYANIFDLPHKFLLKLTCNVFPVVKNDTYSCEDNYKNIQILVDDKPFVCASQENVDTTLAAENAYIVVELPYIPCKDPSSAISTCSGSLGYKIPDFSNFPNPPDLSTVRNNIPSIVSVFGLHGEKCSKAGTKYFCQIAYPFRCKDAYVEIDLKELEASCDEGRKGCSSLNATYRDSLFNCSSFANDTNLQTKFPRKLACNVFPILKNDPYSCEANYK